MGIGTPKSQSRTPRPILFLRSMMIANLNVLERGGFHATFVFLPPTSPAGPLNHFGRPLSLHEPHIFRRPERSSTPSFHAGSRIIGLLAFPFAHKIGKFRVRLVGEDNF